MNPPNLVISFGDNIKSLGDGKFEGYLVRYSDANNPDLTGDYFTDKTEFFIEDGAVLPILYDHGLNATIKRAKIGRGTVKFDDEGLFLKGELMLRDQFEKVIYEELVKKGRAGLSSGAATHLMERKSISPGVNEMVSWGIAEASITVAPTEPLNSVIAIKSYMEDREDPLEKISVPDQQTEDRSMKGIFDANLAENAASPFELLKTFCDVCERVAEATKSLEFTGGSLDIKAKITDAATEYAARLIPLVTSQIENHIENGSGPFYLKAYQADSLQSFLSVKGGLVSESTLDEHSAKVVSAVEEFADLGASLAEGMKTWSKRCKDKIEFRAAKSGKTQADALLQKLTAIHEDMSPVMASITESHATIGDLVEQATPKKSISPADIIAMKTAIARHQTEMVLADIQ